MNFSLLTNYQSIWNNALIYAVQPLLGVEPLTFISPFVEYNGSLYIANYEGGINPPVGVAPDSSPLWTLVFSGSGGSGVTSFNARTGAVIPISGDYNVGQVTGASPLASPTFNGIPTAPTPLSNDSSTRLATTAAILNKDLTGLINANGQIIATDSILQAFNKLSYAPAFIGLNVLSNGDTIVLGTSPNQISLYIGAVTGNMNRVTFPGTGTTVSTSVIGNNSATIGTALSNIGTDGVQNSITVVNQLLTGLSITNSAIIATDSILIGLGKAQGQINSLSGSSITSVFGRFGPAIIAQSGDYTIAEITNGLSNVLSSADIFVGNISNIASAITPSGAWTIDHTGFSTLSAGINALKISSGITNNTDIDNLSGTSANLQSQINALAMGKSFRAAYDASSNLFPSTGGSGGGGAIQMGDYWNITVGGTLGGSTTSPGDLVLALVNTPGQTSSNWLIINNTVVSVFGRAGMVVAQTGDYIVSQITGAAPLASPTFTGIPSAPFFNLTNNINFLISGTTNTMTFTMATLTAPHIFTLPNADSNSVIPSMASANHFAIGISAGGIISYAQPLFTDIGGTATIAQGGTGQTTANNALNALLPSQTGNVNKVLSTDGTNTLWAALSSLGVSSFNTRTGNVIPTSGDYAVAQITGAAPLAGPVFTGIPLAPTASPGTSTTQIATTAFVAAAAAAGVTSFNTRTGAVVPATNDYSFSQISGIALANQGGTGFGAYSIGDILYANTTTTLAKLSDVTIGSVLASGGIGVAPSYTSTPSLAAITLSNNTNQITLGAINTTTITMGSLTGSRIFTLPDGNSNSVIPSIAGINQFAVGINAFGTISYAQPSFANISGTAGVAQGGTNITSYTIGDLIYASGATALSKLADVAVGSVLTSGGVATAPSWNSSPSLTRLTLTGTANQLFLNAGNAGNSSILNSVGLTANREVNFPDADSNTVIPQNQPSSNSFVTGISAGGVISFAFPTIKTDVQQSTTNSGLTTTTDILVAVAPSDNATGYYVLSITGGSGKLTVLYTLKLNFVNFSIQPTFLVLDVSDSQGIINRNNLSNYLTFISHLRTSSPNTYIAVTVRMTGGLLYGATSANFVCTSYAESFLSDNTAITQFISQPLTSLSGLYPPNTSLVINGSTIALGTYPATSLYAYAANGGTTTISLYNINTSTGALNALGSPTQTVGTTPVDVAITPNGQFLYVSCSGSTNIYMFTRNTLTGLLTAVVGSPFTASAAPSYMVMHPTGKYLYVVLGGGSPAVTGYSINQSTGALTLINSIVGGTALHGIAINPLGTFLYVTDSTANNVRQFTINTGTGVLTANGTGTGGLATPEFITVHPNGGFAYVINNGSGSLRVFTVDPNTGVLTATGASIATGSSPLGICITPNGLFAYVANSGSANISFYTVNTSTGLLTLSTTYSTGTTPTCIRVSAGGEYLYITNSGSANITMYSILSSAGTLTAIAGSPVSAGTTVNQLSII